MSLLQEQILGIYVFLTILIFVFHCRYKDDCLSQALRLIVRFSMIAVLCGIIYFSKRIIIINPLYIRVSFILTFIADICFTIEKRSLEMGMKNLAIKMQCLAIGSFIIAYLSLFLTFSYHFTSSYFIYFIFCLVILFLVLFYYLSGSSSKVNKSNILVKGIFVTVWLLAIFALITTSCRGFSSFVSILTTATGILLFISDIFVAYSMFPKFKDNFVCWLENVIWGTYMVGWTFLLLVVSDSSISLF
jgi:hypothetical protein